jgi:ATP-dependent DNA helicase RecQ
VRLAVGGATAEDAEAATLVVRKALSAVARVNGRYGLKAAVALLRGAPDERLVRAGLDRTPTFGALRERSDAWLTSLLGRLVTAGHVEFSGERHPVVRLTPAGREVMLGARPPRVMLPQEEGTRPRGASGRRAGARPAEGDAVLTGDEQQLFDRLRAHRQRLASAQGVPPYVIAHDRTLRELARQRPRTPAELAGIHGMGPSRIERYGAGFLEAVRRFFDGDA